MKKQAEDWLFAPEDDLKLIEKIIGTPDPLKLKNEKIREVNAFNPRGV